MAAELKRITLAVYQRGAELAAERGIIVADTKLEFGTDKDGALVLADEVLTPDSSRYWPADEYQPGRPQYSYDKQFLRDWSTAMGWNRKEPGPEVPADVVAAVAERYEALYAKITGGLTAPRGGERDAGREATRPFGIKLLAFKYRRPQPVSR